MVGAAVWIRLLASPVPPRIFPMPRRGPTRPARVRTGASAPARRAFGAPADGGFALAPLHCAFPVSAGSGLAYRSARPAPRRGGRFAAWAFALAGRRIFVGPARAAPPAHTGACRKTAAKRRSRKQAQCGQTQASGPPPPHPSPGFAAVAAAGTPGTFQDLNVRIPPTGKSHRLLRGGPFGGRREGTGRARRTTYPRNSSVKMYLVASCRIRQRFIIHVPLGTGPAPRAVTTAGAGRSICI